MLGFIVKHKIQIQELTWSAKNLARTSFLPIQIALDVC